MAENGSRKRSLLILAAVIIGLIVLVIALRKKAPLVPFQEIVREDLSYTITSNGKVEPVNPTVARAGFAGFVNQVLAHEGQAVRRGELILTADASDMQSELARARADLLAAQTNLEHAREGGPPDEVAQLEGDLQSARVEVANLERDEQALEDLVAKQAATKEELAQNQARLAKARGNLQALEAKKQMRTQQAAMTLESAELRVRQAQESVRSLEEKVRSATVVAPTDGTLYALPVKAGDYVKTGDTLAEMADLRQVRVRAFVDEPDLGSLEAGQNVEVTWDARPDHIWTGRTGQPPKQAVARGMRSVGEVLCTIDNDRLELLPNTNVQVRILVRERRGALVAPREAVREDRGRHYVFVLVDDKVRRRDITVGVASASKYEVLSGLALKDRVALPAEKELKDGMEVRPTEAD